MKGITKQMPSKILSVNKQKKRLIPLPLRPMYLVFVYERNIEMVNVRSGQALRQRSHCTAPTEMFCNSNYERVVMNYSSETIGNKGCRILTKENESTKTKN